MHPGKRGKIDPERPRILDRLGLTDASKLGGKRETHAVPDKRRLRLRMTPQARPLNSAKAPRLQFCSSKTSPVNYRSRYVAQPSLAATRKYDSEAGLAPEPSAMARRVLIMLAPHTPSQLALSNLVFAP